MAGDPDSIIFSDTALADLKQELAGASQAAESTINTLTRALNQHLAGWTGDAKDAYTQVKHEWDQMFTHMAEVLQHAQIHIDKAREIHRAAERRGADAWGP